MQSNNPVFRRSAAFNGSNRGQSASGYAGYGDPSTWSTGAGGATSTYGQQPGYGYDAPPSYTPQAPTRPMTIDSVVQKTGITLGVVIVAALATWILTPSETEIALSGSFGSLMGAVMIGSLGAFALSMVNSFKRVVSPPLVLAFAALEGVALGGLSKLFDIQFGGGVVSGAVIGTFAAFAGTLTAYKVLDIKVGDKFRKGVMAAVFGMIALSLMELVLSMFGASLGLFGFGGLGLLTAIAGLVLGVFMLILDFDFVEQGIRFGAPEVESWRAAFAMTVSLVWIYTNLLRLLAILQND